MKFNKHGIAIIPKRKLLHNVRDIILMNIHYGKAMQRSMNNILLNLGRVTDRAKNAQIGVLDDLRIYDGKIQ